MAIAGALTGMFGYIAYQMALGEQVSIGPLIGCGVGGAVAGIFAAFSALELLALGTVAVGALVADSLIVGIGTGGVIGLAGGFAERLHRHLNSDFVSDVHKAVIGQQFIIMKLLCEIDG